MAKVFHPLPVYLPGNKRLFEEVRGIAEISDDGRIIITLENEDKALELSKMFSDGILIAVGFDYINSMTRDVSNF